MAVRTFRDFTFDCRGERLRIKIDSGTGSGIPLLICGGFGIPLDLLDDMVKSMPDTTVIRFDPPGIGGSRNRFMPYRFSHLAKVIDGLLRELKLARVDVLGISWGGMLAQEFALAFPDRCRKLILASTLPGIGAVPGNMALHMLASPRKWIMKRRYSRLASLVYGGKVLKVDWRRLERFLAVYAMDLPGYFGQIAASIGWTSILRLRRLSRPVLLLYGEDDSVIPTVNGTIMKTLIPDARLVRLDCGHLFPWTRTEQVCTLISRFRSE